MDVNLIAIRIANQEDEHFIDENRTQFYYLNNKLHREDGPAIEYPDGTKLWYKNDKLHREDGPAVIWADGSISWYLDEKLHREDGPAIECTNGGTKSWYLNGKFIARGNKPENWDDLVKLSRIRQIMEE